MMFRKILLYFHTIRYLKMVQIVYRIKNDLFPVRLVNHGQPIKSHPFILMPALDLNQEYLARFRVQTLLENDVYLLEESHKVNFKTWTVQGQASHLWIFHLQYMEYLIPLAVRYRHTGNENYYFKIKEIMETWISRYHNYEKDAWHPYTISQRLQNWLIVMELLEDKFKKDRAFYGRIEESLYRQYQCLKKRPEKHLMGNHYFENLKAMILFAILFADGRELKKYLAKFQCQVREQILKDGMHYERSFMYHRIMMEDMVRIVSALQRLHGYEKDRKRLLAKLEKMLICTISFEGTLNRVPLFNDAGENGAKPAPALREAVCKCLPQQTAKRVLSRNRTSLPDAGYYKYQVKDMICIIDCGEIGPSYIPGHGHCDCLSYELYRKNIPIIVNAGTYQYQTRKRAYFRSTQAHNSFLVNGCQQSQCWGEHRVAKRISAVKAVQKERVFTGTCRYWNGIRVCRRMIFSDQSILIQDSCTNLEDAWIQSYIHLSPEVEVYEIDQGKYQILHTGSDFRMEIEMLKGETVILHTDDDICWYAEKFGCLQRIKVLEIVGNTVDYKIHWRMEK